MRFILKEKGIKSKGNQLIFEAKKGIFVKLTYTKTITIEGKGAEDMVFKCAENLKLIARTSVLTIDEACDYVERLINGAK